MLESWQKLASPHKVAELKFKHVDPSLKFTIGCDKPNSRRKRRKLVPLYTNRGKTLLETMEEDGKYKGFKFQTIADFTFLPQSDLLIASEFGTVNYPTGRVSVFDEKGERKHTFLTEDKGRDITSFGVTSIDTDTIAICSGEGINLWTVDGHLKQEMTHAYVRNCSHVTSLNKNGLLAATCLTEVNEKCVTIWDTRSGKIVKQFGSRPEIVEINPLTHKQTIHFRNKDLRIPWFIASNSKEDIYISDRSAKCIKVYEWRTGQFLHKFDAAGVDNRCSKGSFSPQGIDIDCDDNIYVNDDVTKGVLLFDKYGEFVKSFPLKLEDPHEMVRLWSLALSTANHDKKRNPHSRLAMSFSNRKPRAHVYNLSFCPLSAIR